MERSEAVKRQRLPRLRAIASLLLVCCLAACGGGDEPSDVAGDATGGSSNGDRGGSSDGGGPRNGDGNVAGTGGNADAAVDANTAPMMTSSDIVSVLAGTTGTIYTATATDDEGDKLVYSISGDDAAEFTINPSTGALAFKTAPGNAASPRPAQRDTRYVITVEVSDGKLSDGRIVSVLVTSNAGSRAQAWSYAGRRPPPAAGP